MRRPSDPRRLLCLIALAGLFGATCSDEGAPPRGDATVSPPADSAPVDLRPADGLIADGGDPDGGAGYSCTAPTNRSLRIFFIGNSFTLGGPIPTLVGSLAANAGFPKPEIKSSAVGGYTLSQHRKLAASTSGVAAGNWDFVVLQEYSTKPTDNAGDPPGFKDDATWFYDQTKAASSKAWVVLYETWARHPDHSIYPQTFSGPAQMQAQLRFHYNDAASAHIPKQAAAASKTDVKVAPAGDAWEKHLAQPGALRLHASDDYHAGVNGQYLNALVIYSTIFGCKASGLTPLSLTNADAARLQAAADATTGITGSPPANAAKPLPVGATIRVDLGPSPTSGQGWNNQTSASGALFGAVTTTGQQTSVSLVITDPFTGTNNVGRADNALGWPATVSTDTLWAGSFSDHSAALGQPAALELRGLPAGRYTLELFASRSGKDGSLDRLGRYSIGTRWKDLDATDNTAYRVIFNDVVVGSGGTIALGVAVSPLGTARFAYLGALILTRVKA